MEVFYKQLKRKGIQYIKERNYLSGLNTFQECLNIGKEHLKDNDKQIDSLINLSVCEYYNGNFKNSLPLIEKAKKIYEKIYLEGCQIVQKENTHLRIKLYTYSSMLNFAMNNYNTSINDIKNIIITIKLEIIIKRKLLYLKIVIYILFKVDSLIYYSSTNKFIKNIRSIQTNLFENLTDDSSMEDEDNNNICKENIKYTEKIIINDFIDSLIYNNNMKLLNSFIENWKKYKENNDFTGYIYCIFYQYLIIYYKIISYNPNDDKDYENDLKEFKDKLNICNKHLIGKQIDDKNKKIINFLKEFNEKMECSRIIFNLLKNIENELNSINEEEPNDLLSSNFFQNEKKLNKKIQIRCPNLQNEIIYIKEEYYINYLKLKRKGFQFLLKRNYYLCFNVFQRCYNISKEYLKDEIKQIDSLINMSICEYYNGNFKNSLFLIEEAKIIYEKKIIQILSYS